MKIILLYQIYIGDRFDSATFNNFWSGRSNSVDPRRSETSTYTASYPIREHSKQTSSNSSSGSKQASHVSVVMGESSLSQPYSFELQSRTSFYDVDNVALDTHMYHCFTNDMRHFTPKQHIKQVLHLLSHSTFGIYVPITVFFFFLCLICLSLSLCFNHQSSKCIHTLKGMHP
jgi:hypothetical protein